MTYLPIVPRYYSLILDRDKTYFVGQGLLIIGAIFKGTVPDESDEERRELERMVAEAATPKPRQHKASRIKREDVLRAKEEAASS